MTSQDHRRYAAFNTSFAVLFAVFGGIDLAEHNWIGFVFDLLCGVPSAILAALHSARAKQKERSNV